MAGQNIPCIVCDSALLNIQEDRCGNQPSGGLAFFSTGHYGCTLFDPMDGTGLEINVCDKCLAIAKAKRSVLIAENSQYDTW